MPIFGFRTVKLSAFHFFPNGVGKSVNKTLQLTVQAYTGWKAVVIIRLRKAHCARKEDFGQGGLVQARRTINLFCDETVHRVKKRVQASTTAA